MENAKKRNNEQNNITIYRSLYRRIFQIPAKKLVDKERKNTAKLIGVLLVLGGFMQGFFTMDFAFDLKLYLDDYSEAAGRAAFAYYVTILNNPFVNIMTGLILIGTHMCSFYGWTFNIITQTKAETDMSLAFRNILFQYVAGTIAYLFLVVPRYIVFIDNFRDAEEDLAFSPSLVQDWGLVIVGRIVMTLLNGNVMISLYKLLTLLMSSHSDENKVNINGQVTASDDKKQH